MAAFARLGYERTTVDAIAREAGVAKGSVYYHFGSKDGVWAALVEERGRRLARASAGGDLETVLKGWVDFFWEERAFLELLLSEAWRDEAREQQVRAVLTGVVDGLPLMPDRDLSVRLLGMAAFGAMAVPALHLMKTRPEAGRTPLYRLAERIAHHFAGV